MSAGAESPEPGRVRAVDEGVAADQWRRVHPISPVLNAWKALAALLAFITYQNIDLVLDVARSQWVRERGVGIILLLVAGGLLLFLLLAAGYSWLAWRATSYAVTDDAVWFRSGILFRTQRHARLDRIQAVDVIHPLLGRLLHLGRLSVEVAGGSDSRFTFGFLSTSDLEELRAEILARAAGLTVSGVSSQGRPGVPGPPSSPGLDPTPNPNPSGGEAAAQAHRGAPAPVAEERVLYHVTPGRLAGSLALSASMVMALVVAVGFLVATVVLVWRFGLAGLSSLWGFAAGAVAFASMLWGRFAGEYNFRAAVSPDGIRVRRGLTETRSQTIPPRRVHALRVEQPLLWRSRGWYRVTISQAGYAGESDQSTSDASQVLLPVGTREQAELAVWLVVRDLGVEDPRGFLAQGFAPPADGDVGDAHAGFLPNPRRSRVLDPLAWRRRAVALTDTALVIRDGRLTRSLTIAPVERLQSVGLEEGPLLRRLGLVDAHMHIVPGAVHVRACHVDAAVARDLVARLLVLARQRRASEPPEKWMTRVGETVRGLGERPSDERIGAALDRVAARTDPA